MLLCQRTRELQAVIVGGGQPTATPRARVALNVKLKEVFLDELLSVALFSVLPEQLHVTAHGLADLNPFDPGPLRGIK